MTDDPNYNSLRAELRDDPHDKSSDRVHELEKIVIGIQSGLAGTKENSTSQYDIIKNIIWVSGLLIIVVLTFTVYSYIRLEDRAGARIIQLEEHMADKFIYLDSKISENTEHFNNRIYELMKTPNNNHKPAKAP